MKKANYKFDHRYENYLISIEIKHDKNSKDKNPLCVVPKVSVLRCIETHYDDFGNIGFEIERFEDITHRTN